MSIEKFGNGYGPGFYQATDISIHGKTERIPNNESITLEYEDTSSNLGHPVRVTIIDKGNTGAQVLVTGPHYLPGRGVRDSGDIEIPVGSNPEFRTLDDNLGDERGLEVIDISPVPLNFYIAPLGLV